MGRQESPLKLPTFSLPLRYLADAIHPCRLYSSLPRPILGLKRMSMLLRRAIGSVNCRSALRLFSLIGSLLLIAAIGENRTAAQDSIDFNRDIRPILSDRCYQCHGPDEQERHGGLRLDLPEAAKAELDSGETAVVPGDTDASALIYRITTDDESLQMPPSESNKSLTQAEVDLLTEWIEQGAAFTQHWSFVPPKRPQPPQVESNQTLRNPIDQFIVKRLAKEGLQQSPEADKATLLRRVTLDLTGLPPTPEELEAFLKDNSSNAYERVVDRLLASPRYAEHRARYWLDAARYGDTHGLHLDNMRQMWPYRDWVIQAFDNNMPYDEFVIKQLAGDLLPDATVEDRVASGFNRCNVTTSEGGSIAAEYRVRYAVDRVETTSTVFMGLTAGCAVCHDHKFDPISQTEFYELYAYFFNFAENEMDGNALLPPPVVAVPQPEYELRKRDIAKQRNAIQQQITEKLAAIDYREPANQEVAPAEFDDYVWIADDVPTGGKAQGNSPWQFVTADKHPVHQGERAHMRKANGLSQHFFTDATQPIRIGEGDVLFAHVFLDPENPPKEIMLQFNDGSSWDHRAYWGGDAIEWGAAGTESRRPMGELPESGTWVRLEVPAQHVGLQPGSMINGWAFTQFDGTVYWDTAGIKTKTPQGGSHFVSFNKWDQYAQSINGNGLPEPVKAAVAKPADQRSDAETQQLMDYFLEFVYRESRDEFDPLHQQLGQLDSELEKLENSVPKTLVMGDRDPEKWETAYVLKRGEYDQPDKDRPVTPNVPRVLPAMTESQPANRLGLAQWLVADDHPLTARVTVNRLWQQLFGTGIVKTSEDFGSQGEFPSHPELLDWLAVEFRESGWDVKRLLKLMVMSHTYRQSSSVLPEHQQKDAANRLYARGPRFRLDAEAIRDSALFLAGILNDEVGGPSVKPYQPAGLWSAVGYTSSNTARFARDEGEKLYRRSMYTFWKRTSPPPTMQIFDAPSREVCVVRRERTNTPAAALAVLNDVQFVEAARCFAERLLQQSFDDDVSRLRYAFVAATSREPNAREKEVLLKLLNKMRKQYGADAEAANKLAATGEYPQDDSLDKQEVAAWTIVTSTILNLDEALTKG